VAVTMVTCEYKPPVLKPVCLTDTEPVVLSADTVAAVGAVISVSVEDLKGPGICPLSYTTKCGQSSWIGV
jgi:hypothetical protein